MGEGVQPVMGDRRTREQIARIVREEVRQALETLIPAVMASQQPQQPQQPAAPAGQSPSTVQGNGIQPQPLPVQPVQVRRLKRGRPQVGRGLNAGLLNAPVPETGMTPDGPSLQGGSAAAPNRTALQGTGSAAGQAAGAASQGATGAASQAAAGTGVPLTGPQLLQEMEANLLRLRQVIRETEALAERMEEFLDGDARGRFAGTGRRRDKRRNPF